MGVLHRTFAHAPWSVATVDGSEIRRSPVQVGSLSHYLQGLIHPLWLFGISSINSMLGYGSVLFQMVLVLGQKKCEHRYAKMFKSA